MLDGYWIDGATYIEDEIRAAEILVGLTGYNRYACALCPCTDFKMGSSIDSPNEECFDAEKLAKSSICVDV
jgi:hypothetical protein